MDENTLKLNSKEITTIPTQHYKDTAALIRQIVEHTTAQTKK